MTKLYKMVEMYEEHGPVYVVLNTVTRQVQSVWLLAKDAKDTVAALNISRDMWKVSNE